MSFNWTDLLKEIASIVFSLFVKDWLQVTPRSRVLWPAGAKEWWERQQRAENPGSDIEEPLVVNPTFTVEEMKDLRTLTGGLQSALSIEEDAWLIRTLELDDRDEGLNRREATLEQRERQLIEWAEGLAARETALTLREDRLAPFDRQSAILRTLLGGGSSPVSEERTV